MGKAQKWGDSAYNYLHAIIICLICFVALQAKGSSQSGESLTLRASNIALSDVFKFIYKQTKLKVSYSNQLFNDREKVSVDFNNTPVKDVMFFLLRGKEVNFEIAENLIIISRKEKESSMITPADTLINVIPSVTGKVTDADGKPVPGATVIVKGTQQGSTTDADGDFTLLKVKKDIPVIISSIGFETREVRVKGSSLLVKLNLLVRNLEEVGVVSTGYQSIPKERATGSFVQISKVMLNQQVGTTVLDRLPAIASGVSVIPPRLNTGKSQLTIRGISTVKGPQGPLIVLDNFIYEGDITNINPNDVESITLLRDAAAASIWGTRAGNGVIVITTKKGKFNEKTRMEFVSSISMVEKPDLFYMKKISASDFIDAEKILFNNGHYDVYLEYVPTFYQTDVVDILEKERKGLLTKGQAEDMINTFRNRDLRRQYMDHVYQAGINQQYAVNARGGTSNLAWVISMGYDKNLDNLRAEYNRVTVRAENTYKLTDKLQLTAGINYLVSNNQSGKDGYGSIPYKTVPPYTLLADENGQQVAFPYQWRRAYLDTVGGGRLLDWYYHPLENYKHQTNRAKLQSFIPKITIKYAVAKWLDLNVSYQSEKQTVNTDALSDAQSFMARDLVNRYSNIDYSTGTVTKAIPDGGILDHNQSELTTRLFRGQANFEHRFGSGSIHAILGTEVRDNKLESINSRYYGYNPDQRTSVDVDYRTQFKQVDDILGYASIPSNSQQDLTINRYVSYYGNISYTLSNKYTVTVSSRRDASNLFGVASNDKWTPLWSAGGSWNISEEPFYTCSFLPNLKLRATYGYSGNIAPGLTAITTISYVPPSPLTTFPRALVSNFQNADLKWEKVGMLNFGVDFTSKRDILSGSIEYYRKKATDLLGFAAYDRTLGLGVPTIQKNNGSLKGSGVDINLNSININRSFKWTTNLLFSYYTDKIIDYYASDERASTYIDGTTAAIGYPRYPVFSYKYAGLDPQTGAPQGYLNNKISQDYYALTGDSASIADLNFHGSAVPKYYGSIGNTFSYKNISLTFRIMYQLGYYFRRPSIDYTVLQDTGDGHEDFGKRWQKPGDEKNTFIPAMDYPADYARSQFFLNSAPLISKGDHIRLQYINLEYMLSKDKTNWLPFSNIRFAFVANNVGLLWKANKYGIDPNFVYPDFPPSRNYSFQIHANL